MGLEKINPVSWQVPGAQTHFSKVDEYAVGSRRFAGHRVTLQMALPLLCVFFVFLSGQGLLF